MPNIQDVSPTTSAALPDQSPTGRMVSIAGAPDGKTLFAGSFSNIWKSVDGGQTWNQIQWPQPAATQFGVPGSLGGWCVVDISVAAGWSVDTDVRVMADLTGNGQSDIVAFGSGGVWTALSNGDGTFKLPRFVVANFGSVAGDWRVDRHPRLLADLTGNGQADIVGFGDAGVWTALSNADGTFQTPRLVVENFGYIAGDWRVEKHPRFLADLTGRGRRADIVGFGDAGVWTALSNGDGTFQTPRLVVENFGYVAGGWRVEKHPRFLADLTGRGRADIVGFGDAGVWSALSNGDGTFQTPRLVVENFGYVAGGWRVEKHPRFLADLAGKRRADIVGFGDAGVWTALSNGDGTFQTPRLVVENFGYVAGGWRVEKHPRLLADLTGTGRADIVGFGDAGVWTALSNGDGTFQTPRLVVENFGYVAGDWRVEKHPRFLADLVGNHREDIVGFGDAGVWTALSNGDGTFQTPLFVLANFGYELNVLAITLYDRETSDSGVWRSSDGGNNWAQVLKFPLNPDGSQPSTGQIVRAPGSDHLVYVAGGTGVGVSQDGGVSFQIVVPPTTGTFNGINHIAVAPSAPDAPAPPAVYAMGDGTMYVSLDGGTEWIQDLTPTPIHGGGVVSTSVSAAPSVLVVSPESPFEVFLVANGGNLWHGDFSEIATIRMGAWANVVMPPPPNPFPTRPFQDSGCVFLLTTPPGQGDLLFLNPLRTSAYVSGLHPASASDWHRLDQDFKVHVDLHGMLLSPDFRASIDKGGYQVKAGTMWLLSDGGISISTDGGNHFHSTPKHLSTLSCVNVAGLAVGGQGPALSLNSGDNDGYYSTDGGANWSPQDYGGGDNDCSYADPLRSYSMLVFTPRWDGSVTVYETSQGSLPNVATGTNQRHTVPGPPATTFTWNANSTFGERGSRPIVLNLPGDDASLPGDYVFIRFTMDNSTSPPTSTQAVLLRTVKLRQINSANDWVAVGTGPTDPEHVFQQGPVLPDPNLGVVQASGGHSATVFYVGGNSTSELWMWTGAMKSWQRLVPGNGANAATRFFVSPYHANLIYLLAESNVMRSDNGGQSWQVDLSLQTQLTCGGRIPIGRATQSDLRDNAEVVLTDMQFDPFHPTVRFAVGEGGVFYTNDGVEWNRLLDTGAFPARPMNCYYDFISSPERALYVAFAGRGLVKISPLPTDGLLIVPSVFGLPRALAQSVIEAAGLVPKFDVATADGVWVFSQTPVAGQIVLPGSTVTMGLRKGPLP